MPSSSVLVALIPHGFDVNWVLGGTRLINDEGTLPERERALLDLYRSTDDEGRAAVDRAVAMEAMRASRSAHAGQPYAGPMPSTRVELHEPALTAPRAKRTRKS